MSSLRYKQQKSEYYSLYRCWFSAALLKFSFFLVFLWRSFSIIIHYSRGSVKIVFLRIYHRGTYSQRSRLAPFLRALRISRYPHDHSRFVNRFSRNCTNLTNPVRLINPACFVVSWFRGIRTAASVLRKASTGSDETLLPRGSQFFSKYRQKSTHLSEEKYFRVLTS